ncbi:MAG: 4Fe-4S dicluster domain-containing protein [Thermodesulfovibrionales bacterium]|nr:4Fe-4S dicluster domain-containing protein [Thermodesulfovibrionales bacterium]
MRAKIKKEDLVYLFLELKGTHKIIGPKVSNNVIVLSEIDFEDLPLGYRDLQSQGSYKLIKSDESTMFGYSVSADSFKRFLNPPNVEILSFKTSKRGLSFKPLTYQGKPLAFFGIRSCDREALRLYDKVFLEGLERDFYYNSIRQNLILIALNCINPGDNCFCASISTGPEVKGSFDLLITELDDCLLIESGSSFGDRLIKVLPQESVNETHMTKKKLVLEKCMGMFKKKISFNKLPDLIYKNIENPRWQEIAKRDLECGNCTQVCPTCFCSTTYDSVMLNGISKKITEISGRKIRVWDSCFSRNFARVHGGNFRLSRKARYRHWFAHKLAYSLEQFSLPGCVGCGRCITWCPMGIDLTQELEGFSDGE